MNRDTHYVLGDLSQNDIGRWECQDLELTSGAILEIAIGMSWIKGRIEHDGRQYVFFDPAAGAAMPLEEGIRARLKVTIH